MPEITSILSIFDDEIFRVDEDNVSSIEALLSNLIPSTSIAVPKAAFPRSETPDLSDKRSSFISVEFTV